MRTSPRSGDWLTLPGAVAGGTSSTGWSSGGGAAGSLAIALALSAGAAASGVRSAVQAASASASSRSVEHTSKLQSLIRLSSYLLCLKQKYNNQRSLY